MRPGEWYDWNEDFKDFRNFVWYVWRQVLHRDPTRRQYDIAHRLQYGPDRDLIQTLRGEGKSWLTGAFVPWVLAWCPWIEFLVVSGAKPKANEFSTFSQQLITTLPELAHLVPRNPRRWSKEAFDVEGAVMAAQVASVTSRGIFGQITGARGHFIIPDDVETPNTSETFGMREKLANRCMVEFPAILIPDELEPDRPEWVPRNSIKYLGTPHHLESLYKKLRERNYHTFMIPAEFPNPARAAILGGDLARPLREMLEADPSLAGRPTDPERFNEETLAEQLSEMGKSGYALQMLLDTSEDDALRHPLKLQDLVVFDVDEDFGPDRLAWTSSPEYRANDLPSVGVHGDFFYRPMMVGERLLPWDGRVMTVDPSGRGADETSACVSKMLNARVYIAEMFASTDGFTPATLEKLALLAKKHKVNEIQVEDNFGDGMFIALLIPVLRKVYPCKVTPVKHSGQKEVRIINALEAPMNSHRVAVSSEVVLWDMRTHPDVSRERVPEYRLFHQMTRLSKDRGSLRHDDRLESFAMAVEYWRDAMSQIENEAADRNDRRRAHQASINHLAKLGVKQDEDRRAGMPWSRHTRAGRRRKIGRTRGTR